MDLFLFCMCVSLPNKLIVFFYHHLNLNQSFLSKNIMPFINSLYLLYAFSHQFCFYLDRLFHSQSEMITSNL